MTAQELREELEVMFDDVGGNDWRWSHTDAVEYTDEVLALIKQMLDEITIPENMRLDPGLGFSAALIAVRASLLGAES